MKHVPTFNRGEALPELPLQLELDPRETVIGWYRNPAPWEDHVLVFSDAALYSLAPSEFIRLAWKDVMGYQSPESKIDLSGVRVRTPEGFCFVRIAGSHGPEGKFKDAFGLMMVLRAMGPEIAETD